MDRVESALENQMDIIIQARFQFILEIRSNMSRSLFLALAIFTPTQNENPAKFNRVKAAKDSSDVQFWQKQNIFVDWEVIIAIWSTQQIDKDAKNADSENALRYESDLNRDPGSLTVQVTDPNP